MGVPVGCAVVRADGYDSQLRLVANFSNKSLSAETGYRQKASSSPYRLVTLCVPSGAVSIELHLFIELHNFSPVFSVIRY